MKSCKTQTSVCETSLLQPVTSEPQYVFSPVEEQQPGSVLKGYLMPMAIPLGRLISISVFRTSYIFSFVRIVTDYSLYFYPVY